MSLLIKLFKHKAHLYVYIFPMPIISITNLLSRTMVLGSTQPLTELSARKFPGVKGRTVLKAQSLAVICEQIV
jgi:hypothetical protein